MARIPREQPPPGFSYVGWERVREQGALQQEAWRSVMHQTPAERLAWLLEFLRENLGSLTPEDRAVRGYKLRALHGDGAGEFDLFPMADATLRALQHRIGEGVRGFAGRQEGFWWRIPGPKEIRVSRIIPPVKPRRGGAEVPTKLRLHIQRNWERDEVGWTLNGVAELLRAAGENLRACVRCREPFLGRKRAIYCSEDCGQKRRDARKQARATKARPARGRKS